MSSWQLTVAFPIMVYLGKTLIAFIKYGNGLVISVNIQVHLLYPQLEMGENIIESQFFHPTCLSRTKPISFLVKMSTYLHWWTGYTIQAIFCKKFWAVTLQPHKMMKQMISHLKALIAFKLCHKCGHGSFKQSATNLWMLKHHSQ